MDQSGDGAGQTNGEEYFAIVVENVVDVGYRLRHVVVLQEVLVYVGHLLPAAVLVDVEDHEEGSGQDEGSGTAGDAVDPG